MKYWINSSKLNKYVEHVKDMEDSLDSLIEEGHLKKIWNGKEWVYQTTESGKERLKEIQEMHSTN